MKWDVVASVATAIVPVVVGAGAYFSWFVKITFKSNLTELMEKLDDRYVRRNGGTMTIAEVERHLQELKAEITLSQQHRHSA